jgi:hypothetical protein
MYPSTTKTLIDFLLCFLFLPYVLYSIAKSRAIQFMEEENKEMENGNKCNLFYVDAMFSWSSIPRHELKKNCAKKC